MNNTTAKSSKMLLGKLFTRNDWQLPADESESSSDWLPAELQDASSEDSINELANEWCTYHVYQSRYQSILTMTWNLNTIEYK